MKFVLDGLMVYFPYTYIYPEQYNYMLALKRSIDAGGPCVLEMPSGTGKTVTLLSLITSYQVASPELGKLVYCTRTVGEMEKVLEELRRVIAYRDQQLGTSAPKYLGVGLSSRKNLCIHEKVSSDRSEGGVRVDAMCRDRTASWVRDKFRGQRGDNGNKYPQQLCEYYENYEEQGKKELFNGVYSLDDLKELGKKHRYCPYFLARHLITHANFIVYSYFYLLDPKIASMVSQELASNSIVVFDEAHNIDDVCIEALSVFLTEEKLHMASRNITTLSTSINAMKQQNAKRLRQEYQRLVDGMATDLIDVPITDITQAEPVLADDIVKEVVPGNIRRAEHFLGLLRRFVEYLKRRVRVTSVISMTPPAFLYSIKQADSSLAPMIEPQVLKFCTSRLGSLLRTLEITELNKFSPLSLVANFATLLGTYASGFVLMIEPGDAVQEPVIQFCCLDASLAIAPVFKKFRNVVITSGTLSPLGIYPKILNFNPVISERFSMSLHRPCACPIIVTRGSDQTPVTSRYDVRNDPGVIRNYGQLLIECAGATPDGVVAFFPSYEYMEGVIAMWNEMDVLNQVLKHKLLFVETTDTLETSLALENYRKACDNGRGAVFFSVARGKISEGIDFDHHYGRCVIMLGIPYVYTESRVLRERLNYLRDKYKVNENDFLTFDAMRQAAQCAGRVIRGKTDYGAIIFADKRYSRMDKRSKLPHWMGQFLDEGQVNLSTESAVALMKKFFREVEGRRDSNIASAMMAQPIPKEAELGKSLWTIDHVLSQPTSRAFESSSLGVMASSAKIHCSSSSAMDTIAEAMQVDG